MIKRILLCILAGMSLTAMAAPPTAGKAAGKIDERLLLKRLPAPEAKDGAKPVNPFKAPVRVNPLKAPLSNSQFYGTVVSSADWTEYYLNNIEPPYGVYSLPKEIDDSATPELTNPLFANVVSGFYRENTYAVMTQRTSEDYSELYVDYYEFDTDSWRMTKHIELNDPTYIASDMAYNPADGLVYGSFYNESITGCNFASFDPETLDYNVIAPIPDSMRYYACTADNDGHIYAINDLGDFLSVDPDSGEETIIGPTGVSFAPYVQSMTWDASSGQIYWVTVLDSNTALYLIDPSNGEAHETGPMPASEEFAGMFIPFREAADGAPSQIADLESSFPDGALSGKVTFTLPSTDNMGNALSGELSYVVTINGVDKTRGNGNAGDAISIDTELETGQTTIEVRASNNAGKSPVARSIFWAGNDTPKAVENLTLKNENGQAMLTWTLPDTGVHDGYVDATATTYEIVRFPDNVTVAQAHGETTFTDALTNAGLDIYSYSVTPVFAGNRGDAVSTVKMLFGEASTIPYFEGFDNEARYDAMFTAVDANNDDNTWRFFSNYWHGFDTESGAADIYMPESGNDDYLVSSKIRLQADVDYHLTAQMAGGDYPLDFYGNVMDIYISTSPEVGTFTTKLAFDGDAIRIDRSYQQVNSTFSVENDGDYYIAYHSKGARNDDLAFFSMMIDWVKIEEISDFKAPAKISDLKLEADESGEPNTTVSFTAPAKTYDGSDLDNISNIVICRDSVPVKTFENVEPGAPLTFNDTDIEEGMRHYTVVANNSYGRSVAAIDSVYVGHDTPSKVTGVKATDEGSEIHLTWDAATTGANGGYINPDEVTYVITDDKGWPLAEGITATEWKEAAETEGEMKTHIYNVAAVYDGRTGEAGLSEGVVTGTPLQTPFHESFADGKYQNEGWWTTYDTQAYGHIYQFVPLHGSSADSDREAMAFEAYNYWDSPDGVGATLNTGKISLKDVENPSLIFWYYGFAEDADLTLEVMVNDCGKSTEKVWEVVFKPSDYMDAYQRAEIPLTEFAGHDYIYVSFRGRNFDSYWAGMAIDNVQIRNVYDNNLTVDMQLPANLTTGISNDLYVTLHNTGATPIPVGYKVSIRQNGNEIATAEGPTLESDEAEVICIEIKPEVTEGEQFELSAEADYADDLADDNISAKTANALIADLPATETPTITNDAEGVKISWTEPDMSGVGPTLEDFESYEPWMHNAFGQWLSIDIDKEGDLVDARMYFPEAGMPSSFFTFNPYVSNESFMEDAPEYEPHSGEQFIANYNVAYMYAQYTETNNDWLVSPRLSGRAQTVTFYAKALGYYEPFNVLYSTTGTDIDDFTMVYEMFVENYGDGEWQEFEFEVPEGARYFAIQSTGYDTWALFIDDITYEGLCDYLEPAGFNIYRDGKLIGTVEAGTCFFVDPQAPDKCTYSVTALYNAGESAPASVNYDRSGIAAIDSSLKVFAADEAIIIRGGEGLTALVYSIDGMLVASATLDGDTRIAVTPGVYVVETGDYRTKVIVR